MRIADRKRTPGAGARLGLALAAFSFGLLFASTAAAQVDTYTVGVDGMACPFCAYGIEKKLKALEGVDSLDIEIKKGTVDVHVAEGADVTPEAIDQAIEDAGFEIRDLTLAGEGTVEQRDGSKIARFSEDFELTIRGDGPETGEQSLRGEVVQKQGTWKLVVGADGGGE